MLEETGSGSSPSILAVNTFGADGLVSRWTNTSGLTHWQAFDPMGNLANEVDGSGNGAGAPLYSAYGKTALFGTAPWGYQAQWGGRTEAGFVVMGHRYYDPQAGRFITRDPIGYGGGINLYSYAGNNPVNFSDPSGLSWRVGGHRIGWGDVTNEFTWTSIRHDTMTGLAAIGNFCTVGLIGNSYSDRSGFSESLGALQAGAWAEIAAMGGAEVLGAARGALGLYGLYQAGQEIGSKGGSATFEEGAIGPYGDLTPEEIEKIQDLTNKAGRSIHVVGSAARGARRGIGTNLPICKGPGTRSDTLPGYAPDLNPTEALWSFLKQKELGNVSSADLVRLRHELHKATERVRDRPLLLQSFFQLLDPY